MRAFSFRLQISPTHSSMSVNAPVQSETRTTAPPRHRKRRTRRTWTDGYGGGKAAPHRNRASRRRQTATSRVEKSVSYITPHSCSLPLASRMAQLFMRQMQPSFFIFYKNISRCRYRIRPDIVRVKYACRNFRKARPPTAPFARTHEKHGVCRKPIPCTARPRRPSAGRL